jgi:hypothetical protein
VYASVWQVVFFIRWKWCEFLHFWVLDTSCSVFSKIQTQTLFVWMELEELWTPTYLQLLHLACSSSKYQRYVSQHVGTDGKWLCYQTKYGCSKFVFISWKNMMEKCVVNCVVLVCYILWQPVFVTYVWNEFAEFCKLLIVACLFAEHLVL